ncbi:unnamed protein product [Anisakis simplex]|uniref:BZIP domain-containing protein n=1 Tax=Anisakis simplex TaxID=6269 RepID=A0A0M3K2N0_ANISI|nr:unnamed protein product [Anisakis simplex]
MCEELSSDGVLVSDKNNVSMNIDKLISPNRRCRRRADLPPDVLAKVRERDKERKRLTRVRKQMNAINGDCSQLLHPNENAYNQSFSNKQSKTSTNDNSNEWSMKTLAMNVSNGSNRSENGYEVEDDRKANSLSVQEYLIKQTLTAEQTKDVDQKNNQNSNLSGSIYNDNIYYYYNDPNVSLPSLPAQPSNAVYNDLATAPNGCGGDSNNAPLILTKISGFEVINVAADYNNDDLSRILNGNLNDELKLQSNNSEVNGSERMNLFGHGSDANEQLKDKVANDATKADNSKGELMTDKSNEEQSVKKARRRAPRSRSVLPPDKLAFIRAIDAERKRIARTRSRLLKMKNRMTADNKSDAEAKKSRLLKQRKHAISIEDATRYGWPQLNDERKERMILQRRFEKYRIIIEKMIENEKEMCGGEVPLEILRAMVVEQAKFFSFLTQRNDSRCGRFCSMQPSSDNITTTTATAPDQQSSEPIS